MLTYVHVIIWSSACLDALNFVLQAKMSRYDDRYDDHYDRYDNRYDRYADRYDRYADRYDRSDRYGGNTKLYVGHLSKHTRTQDVELLFGRYGRWGNWIWIYAFCAPLDLTSFLV